MSKLILITGGARSGKSDYAQKRAEDISGNRFFVATCPLIDPEMDDRISRHKIARQGLNWQTIEEELDLCTTLKSLPKSSVCLVDCLTLWVNNLMYHAKLTNNTFGEDEMQIKAQELATLGGNFNGTLICVSNEVGMGIVPDNAAGRHYRDLVGKTNRIIAKAANEVILVSCGLPLFLKEANTAHS